MDMMPVRWRKSSFSGAQSDCVEVAHTRDAVRDSKRPTVVLGVDTRRLLDAVRAGRFGR